MTVEYVYDTTYMNYSCETDELILVYFRFVHKFFIHDHAKTTTQKIWQCNCTFSRSWFLDSTFVVCEIKALSSAFCAIVPSGSDCGEPGSLSGMVKCIAKLLTC